MEPAPHIVSAISDGLLDPTHRVVKVRAVEVAPERRNTSCWPALFVAARIETGEGQLDGVWATAALGGPIFAVDAVARECSTWGSAAGGGSKAGEMKDMFAGYPELEGVRRVLRGT